MTKSQILLAIEQIKQLKARYFRAMDTKDWTTLEGVFTPDIVCDYREAFGDPAKGEASDASLLHGRDAVVAYIRSGLSPIVSVHQGHMPEIDVVDDRTATGIWSMTDLLRFPVGPVREIRGYGHYHEGYRRNDAAWRITTLKLTRLLVDTVPSVG